MGRKGSWFSSVKKALSPDSKAKKHKKENKSKKNWFGKEKPLVSDSLNGETIGISHPHPLPPLEDVKLLTGVENEQTKHAYSAAVATVAAAQAVAEVVRLTSVSQFVGKFKEEVAAIKIQTAFRGYLARRALRALRGLVRLKSLVDGPTVKRQTANTLKCMQILSRVQCQIQSRRIGMSEENQALQRQLLQKRAKELESLRMGDEWDDSLQSKEQIEANLLNKFEAAIRRERALAYSYTHQQTWKKSSKSANLLFMDPTNPSWGWSWLERWMAPGPRDSQSTVDKDLNTDPSSVKNASMGTTSREITKSFARHQLNSKNPSSPASQKPPSTHQSPATPPSRTTASAVAARKLKAASSRGSAISQDDDSRSIISMQSERNRRHSIAGSSVRDDESLASSLSVPSYMAPTQSAKSKSRLSSPFEMENGNTPEKTSIGSAKKRLSFPPSPARGRRHLRPPKMESFSIAESDVNGVLN